MLNLKSLALLTALLSTSALAQNEVNIDVRNVGPDAYDFAVVLKGAENIGWTYDGSHSENPYMFEDVTKFQMDGKTFIHWQNLGGDDKVIKSGSTIHIGWHSDGSTDVLDMYFTDRFGQRIRCSQAIVVGGHFDPVDRFFTLRNGFDVAVAAEALDVRAAVMPAAVPLAQLNPENAELMARLQFLTSRVTVPPGGEGVRLAMPRQLDLADGETVVLVYRTVAPENSAELLSFSQFPLQAGKAAKAAKAPAKKSQR